MIANGKYMKDGQEKTRWVNIGIIGVSQNGKEYMMLDPTINLAGFKREDGRDMVMVSIFEDNRNNQGGYGGQNNAQPQQQYQQQHTDYQPQQMQQQQYQPTLDINEDDPF